MPQFRILTHDYPSLHWDLLLEFDGTLRTWRLLTEPDRSGSTDAEQLNDHRIEYLTYEGPISGNRGSVKEWDAGHLEWIEDEPEHGTVTVRLQGKRLGGLWQLTRRPAASQSPDDPERWRFEPMEARPGDQPVDNR